MKLDKSKAIRFLIAWLAVALYVVFLAPRMRINLDSRDNDAFLFQLLSIFFAVLVVCFLGFRKDAKRKWLSVLIRIVSGVVVTIIIAFGVANYPTIDQRFDTAVERGNAQRVERILENNRVVRPGIGSMYTNQLTTYDLEQAFHEAFRQDRWDIVELVIEHGLDLNQLRFDPDHPNPLIRAIEEADAELFERLVSLGADPMQEAPWLLAATLPANPAGLRIVMDAGIDPHTPIDGTPLFHWLIVEINRLEAGNHETREAWAMADLLISLGSDVNGFDRLGHTPLMRVTEDQVRETLIEMGAEPVQRDPRGWTPLHRAVAAQNLDEIRRLIDEQPVSVNVGGPEGSRPLHIAINETYFDMILPIVRLLLEAGADPNVADSDNYRPLHNVAYRFSLPTFRLLLETGADPNVITRYGETVFTAHAMANPEAVMLLLDHGAVISDIFVERARSYATDEINAMIQSRLGDQE